MKKVISVLTILLVCLSVSSCTVYNNREVKYDKYLSTDDSARAYFLSATEKKERDGIINPTANSSLIINMVKNEKELGQFVIRNDSSDMNNVSAYVSELKDSHGNIISIENLTLSRARYYQVWDISEDRSYYMPDALIPLFEDNNKTDIKKGENQAFYLSVKTDAVTAAGTYEGMVKVIYDGGEMVIPVYVTVNDITIPEATNCRTLFGTYHFADAYEGIEIGAYGMLFEYLLDNRMCMLRLPGTTGVIPEYKQVLKKYAFDERVNSFVLPVWGADHWTGVSQMDDVADSKNRELQALLNEMGIAEKGVYYIMDEISGEEKYAQARELCEYMSSLGDVNNLITLSSKAVQMDGYLQVWCPGREGTEASDVDRIKQNGGKSVWWYGTEEVMIGLNNLDECKSLFWTQKQFGIEGYLHWAVDMYTKYNWETDTESMMDYWNDPYSFYPVDAYGEKWCFGGDTYLVYPGREDDGIVNRNMVVPSIRFETIRDGIEDFDLLTIREEQINRQLAEYGITDKKASDFMNVYYEAMTNSVSFDSNRLYSDFDRYNEIRSMLIRDILADESILVELVSNKSNGEFKERTLNIFAPKNSDVYVNSVKTEFSDGFYTLTMDCNYIKTVLDIKVSGEYEYDISYNVYPHIEYDFYSLADFETDGENLYKIIDNDKYTLSGGRLHIDFSKGLRRPGVDSKIFDYGNKTDWSGYSFLKINIKNEGQNNLELEIMTGGNTVQVGFSLSEALKPSEQRTLYIPIEGLDKNIENVSKITFNSKDSNAHFSVGYFGLCQII